MFQGSSADPLVLRSSSVRGASITCAGRHRGRFTPWKIRLMTFLSNKFNEVKIKIEEYSHFCINFSRIIILPAPPWWSTQGLVNRDRNISTFYNPSTKPIRWSRWGFNGAKEISTFLKAVAGRAANKHSIPVSENHFFRRRRGCRCRWMRWIVIILLIQPIFGNFTDRSSNAMEPSVPIFNLNIRNFLIPLMIWKEINTILGVVPL